MKHKPPLIDEDGEVLDMTQWDDDDFNSAVPFSALPDDLQKLLLGLKNTPSVHAKKQAAR